MTEGKEGTGRKKWGGWEMNWMPVMAPMTILVGMTAQVPFMGTQSWCHCAVRMPELGTLGRDEGERWERKGNKLDTNHDHRAILVPRTVWVPAQAP